MKHYRLLNSDDGMIVEEVDGRSCSYCTSAFIYKDDKIYHLIDKASGQTICKSFRLNYLEDLYKRHYKNVMKNIEKLMPIKSKWKNLKE